AGARPVFHDHALIEQIAELVSNDARDHVAARAGCKADDEADGARWIVVGAGRLCEDGESGEQEDERTVHASSGLLLGGFDFACRGFRYKPPAPPFDGLAAAFRPTAFDRAAGIDVVMLVPIAQRIAVPGCLRRDRRQIELL